MSRIRTGGGNVPHADCTDKKIWIYLAQFRPKSILGISCPLFIDNYSDCTSRMDWDHRRPPEKHTSHIHQPIMWVEYAWRLYCVTEGTSSVEVARNSTSMYICSFSFEVVGMMERSIFSNTLVLTCSGSDTLLPDWRASIAVIRGWTI